MLSNVYFFLLSPSARPQFLFFLPPFDTAVALNNKNIKQNNFCKNNKLWPPGKPPATPLYPYPCRNKMVTESIVQYISDHFSFFISYFPILFECKVYFIQFAEVDIDKGMFIYLKMYISHKTPNFGIRNKQLLFKDVPKGQNYRILIALSKLYKIILQGFNWLSIFSNILPIALKRL